MCLTGFTILKNNKCDKIKSRVNNQQSVQSDKQPAKIRYSTALCWQDRELSLEVKSLTKYN